mgnify:CR=1 FL=1
MESGHVVACRYLTAVQAFGSSTETETNTTDDADASQGLDKQTLLSHPIHLFARMPAFHSYVIGLDQQQGKRGSSSSNNNNNSVHKGKGKSSSRQKKTGKAKQPHPHNGGAATTLLVQPNTFNSALVETCTVVLGPQMFRRRLSLQRADDKDSVGAWLAFLYCI